MAIAGAIVACNSSSDKKEERKIQRHQDDGYNY